VAADCMRTRAALPGIDELAELGADQRGHIAGCLRCQADAARYRKLRRALRDLRRCTERDDPGVLAGILAALDDYDARVARRAAAIGRAAIVLGGLAAATAGATGAVALARGRRHRLPVVG
jgi:hypothetical protein